MSDPYQEPGIKKGWTSRIQRVNTRLSQKEEMINKLLDKFNKIGCYNSLLKIHHQQVGGYLCTFTSFLRFFLFNFTPPVLLLPLKLQKRVGKRKKMSIPFLSPSGKSIKINCRSIKKHVSILGTQVSIIKNTLGRFKIIIKDVV